MGTLVPTWGECQRPKGLTAIGSEEVVFQLQLTH